MQPGRGLPKRWLILKNLFLGSVCVSRRHGFAIARRIRAPHSPRHILPVFTARQSARSCFRRSCPYHSPVAARFITQARSPASKRFLNAQIRPPEPFRSIKMIKASSGACLEIAVVLPSECRRAKSTQPDHLASFPGFARMSL